jgi:protein SCO1/2
MKRFFLIITIAFALILKACGQEKMPVIKKAPEFELTSIQGDTVSIKNTNGKVRLVYFYYSSCNMVCLPTNGIMAKIQSELKKEKIFGDQAALISIAVDTKRDTVEKLTTYSKQLNADLAGWYFLRTDDFPKVQAIAADYSISVTALEDGEFIHTNAFTLVDAEGQIRKVYTSSEIEPKNAPKIAADMNQLVKEAKK